MSRIRSGVAATRVRQRDRSSAQTSEMAIPPVPEELAYWQAAAAEVFAYSRAHEATDPRGPPGTITEGNASAPFCTPQRLARMSPPPPAPVVD